MPVAIVTNGGEKDFVPPEGTFRTLPFGHASCFANCHWDKDDPKKDNCAGCHFTISVAATKKVSAFSRNASEWFRDWPRQWPQRVSLKFSHESKNHREEDNPELTCTECHSMIRQSEPLKIPDVPLSTCAKSKCHFDPETRRSRTSLYREMFAEDDDIALGKNNDPLSRAGQNTCTGCHSRSIGSFPPPCSHYLIYLDDPDFKNGKYPNIARYISEQCKK